MKTFLLVVAIALALNAGESFAKLDESITVVGRKSCGFWAKSRADEDQFSKTVLQNWVMGYLSGVAMTKGSDFLRDLDGDSVFLWYDQYCQANPLDTLVDASEKLVKERHRK